MKCILCFKDANYIFEGNSYCYEHFKGELKTIFGFRKELRVSVKKSKDMII